MRYKTGKMFYEKSGSMSCVPYDSTTIEYYTFLRDCRNNGLHQVIVTSEMMVDLIESEYAKHDRKLIKIEFMEEDSETEQFVCDLIKAVNNNPYQLPALLDYLRQIAEESSVEIKSIYIKGSYAGEIADNYFVQSNGIIGVNKESFDSVSKEIGTFIERCLNG